MRRLFIIISALLFTGCELRQAMYDQARIKPLGQSDFFKDGQGARPLVEGTIPVGHLREDELLYRGNENGKLSERFPFPITEADLKNGRTQFEVFCSVCHGYTGIGNGMIVQRGFRQPPDLHEDRLREAPVGHIFNTITNGMNTMPAYGKMIPVKERWQIVAYVKVLQASQGVRVGDLDAEERKRLEESEAAAESKAAPKENHGH